MKHSGLFTYRNDKCEKTPMHVIGHACFQLSRGRKPSETYKGERNPRKALARARDDLAAYSDCVSRIIDLVAMVAKLGGEGIPVAIDGVNISVTPTSSASDLIEKFRSDCIEMIRRCEKY